MSNTPNIVRVDSPEGLLPVVPTLLGYVPTDSVVMLCLREGRLAFSLRVDLPRNAQEAQEMVENVLPAVIRHRPENVVLVGYETVTPRPLTAAALRVLTAATSLANLSLFGDPLVVGERGWEHLDCDCCPEPHPIPEDAPAALAARVASGIAPATSRAEVEARVQPSQRAEEVRAAAAQVSVQQERDVDAVALAWGRLLDPSSAVETVPAPVLALAARGIGVPTREMRDVLMAWLCPGWISLDILDEATVQAVRSSVGEQWGAGLVDRLCQVCSALPDEEAVPTLTLLAAYAWWAGNGTVAWCALDRAGAIDSDYRMAELLRRMVAANIRFPGQD